MVSPWGADDDGNDTRYDHDESYDELDRLIARHPVKTPKAMPEQPRRTMPTIADLYDFEAAWPGKHTAAKEEAIRDRFGAHTARYYSWLHRAIDTPEGLEHDPILTHRLQNARDTRAADRANRTTYTHRKGTQ